MLDNGDLAGDSTTSLAGELRHELRSVIGSRGAREPYEAINFVALSSCAPPHPRPLESMGKLYPSAGNRSTSDRKSRSSPCEGGGSVSHPHGREWTQLSFAVCEPAGLADCMSGRPHGHVPLERMVEPDPETRARAAGMSPSTMQGCEPSCRPPVRTGPRQLVRLTFHVRLTENYSQHSETR